MVLFTNVLLTSWSPVVRRPAGLRYTESCTDDVWFYSLPPSRGVGARGPGYLGRRGTCAGIHRPGVGRAHLAGHRRRVRRRRVLLPSVLRPLLLAESPPGSAGRQRLGACAVIACRRVVSRPGRASLPHLRRHHPDNRPFRTRRLRGVQVLEGRARVHRARPAGDGDADDGGRARGVAQRAGNGRGAGRRGRRGRASRAPGVSELSLRMAGRDAARLGPVDAGPRAGRV